MTKSTIATSGFSELSLISSNASAPFEAKPNKVISFSGDKAFFRISQTNLESSTISTFILVIMYFHYSIARD